MPSAPEATASRVCQVEQLGGTLGPPTAGGLRRDAHLPMDATSLPVMNDPGRTEGEWLASMGRFGHVFMCVSGDLKDRGQRRWICR